MWTSLKIKNSQGPYGVPTLFWILPPGALAGFYSEDAGRAKSSCFERCPEHSVLPNKICPLG